MSKVNGNKRVEMAFDLSGATARDMAPHLRDLKTGKIAVLGQILARVATSCPEHWGPPDAEATYAKLPLQPDLGLAYAALQMELQADTTKVYARFDLAGITAAEFDAINASINQGDPEKIAALLAQYVVECEAVSDVASVDAYLDLPYYTVFRKLANALNEQAQADLQNFLKRFTV